MALRGTLTHWKTRMLAKDLGIMPCHALGILEALWHVTAELAPAGNIGRLPNAAIAMEMFYDGDEDTLIVALVRSKHLDTDQTHRLVVHDWHLYSDDATDNKIARAGQLYATGEEPRMRRMSKDERKRLTESHGYSVRTESHKKPLPVPVPVPVPVPEPVIKKPSRAKPECDPRHAGFKEAVMAYAAHKRVTLAWDGSEAKALDLLLKSAPKLTLAEFQACLNNRSHSHGTTHGDRPRVWLPNILKYQQGPLDQFNKLAGSAQDLRPDASVGIKPHLSTTEPDDGSRVAYWAKMRDQGNAMYRDCPGDVKRLLEAQG